MEQYISKSALVAEIERRQDMITKGLFSIPLTGRERADATFEYEILGKIKEFLDTLEVKDPYEQVIQYPSIEDGIKAHAEDYSWNIESELFQQLTPEQQKLWRKEIEQAVISGGYSGLNFARDTRYKENIEVKEVNLDKEMNEALTHLTDKDMRGWFRYFFELGLLSRLTWQDIRLISDIGEDFMNSEESDNLSEEEYYTEILNKFKAQKEK